MSAAMAMQEAEAPATARQIAACDEARTLSGELMGRWEALSREAMESLTPGGGREDSRR